MTDGKKKKRILSRSRSARESSEPRTTRDAPKSSTESRRTRFSRIPGRSRARDERYVNIRVVGVVCDRRSEATKEREQHQHQQQLVVVVFGSRQRRQKRRRLVFLCAFFFAFFFRVLFLLLWVENTETSIVLFLNTKGEATKKKNCFSSNSFACARALREKVSHRFLLS